MTIMRNFFIFCSVLLLFVSCQEDNAIAPLETRATRAIMIYMAAENSLTFSNETHFLSDDLKEMIEGSKLLDDNQRVFVFVDSLDDAPITDFWYLLDEDQREDLLQKTYIEEVQKFFNDMEEEKKRMGTPYILELHGGEAKLMKRFSEDFYSCDPDKFVDVISWMTDNVKADGYGLVLWGHATGWTVQDDTIPNKVRRAYALDNGLKFKSVRKWMNITQMEQALKKLPKFDFIFADCCEMVSAEIGFELRDATDYLIGSPAEIPGNGAPYDKMLPKFFKNGSDLYRSIIDTYYDYYTQEFDTLLTIYAWKSHSVPLSVIDTRYMEALAVATHDILGKFSGGYPNKPEYPSVTGIAFYEYRYDPVMYDMRAFIKQHTSDADFQQWDKVYQQAVPYYRMSMAWKTVYDSLIQEFKEFNQDKSVYGCMSMFIPLNLPSYTTTGAKYNLTANNFEWNRRMDWSRFGW